MGEENMTAQEVEVAVEEAAQDTGAVEAKEEIVEVSSVADASNNENQEPDQQPKVYADNFWGKCQKGIDKAWAWVKKTLHLPTLTKKQKAKIWDKFTTGLLIFLFCTPFLVLLYILLWFVLK